MEFFVGEKQDNGNAAEEKMDESCVSRVSPDLRLRITDQVSCFGRSASELSFNSVAFHGKVNKVSSEKRCEDKQVDTLQLWPNKISNKPVSWEEFLMETREIIASNQTDRDDRVAYKWPEEISEDDESQLASIDGSVFTEDNDGMDDDRQQLVLEYLHGVDHEVFEGPLEHVCLECSASAGTAVDQIENDSSTGSHEEQVLSLSIPTADPKAAEMPDKVAIDQLENTIPVGSGNAPLECQGIIRQCTVLTLAHLEAGQAETVDAPIVDQLKQNPSVTSDDDTLLHGVLTWTESCTSAAAAAACTAEAHQNEEEAPLATYTELVVNKETLISQSPEKAKVAQDEDKAVPAVPNAALEEVMIICEESTPANKKIPMRQNEPEAPSFFTDGVVDKEANVAQKASADSKLPTAVLNETIPILKESTPVNQKRQLKPRNASKRKPVSQPKRRVKKVCFDTKTYVLNRSADESTRATKKVSRASRPISTPFVYRSKRKPDTRVSLNSMAACSSGDAYDIDDDGDSTFESLFPQRQSTPKTRLADIRTKQSTTPKTPEQLGQSSEPCQTSDSPLSDTLLQGIQTIVQQTADSFGLNGNSTVQTTESKKAKRLVKVDLNELKQIVRTVVQEEMRLDELKQIILTTVQEEMRIDELKQIIRTAVQEEMRAFLKPHRQPQKQRKFRRPAVKPRRLIVKKFVVPKRMPTANKAVQVDCAPRIEAAVNTSFCGTVVGDTVNTVCHVQKPSSNPTQQPKLSGTNDSKPKATKNKSKKPQQRKKKSNAIQEVVSRGKPTPAVCSKQPTLSQCLKTRDNLVGELQIIDMEPRVDTCYVPETPHYSGSYVERIRETDPTPNSPKDMENVEKNHGREFDQLSPDSPGCMENVPVNIRKKLEF